MKTTFRSIAVLPAVLLFTVTASPICHSEESNAGPKATERQVSAEQEANSVARQTIAVIAKLRGAKESAVTLRTSTNGIGGPFEVDTAGVADTKTEAEQLSRELGPSAVVILDHASATGFRTNWAFRNGVGEERVAPLDADSTRPGTKRLLVWPKGQSSPGAPRNITRHPHSGR